MNDKVDEQTQSPFDNNGEDETIALSKDELDNILSEAEIVQEVAEEGQGTEDERIESDGESSVDNAEAQENKGENEGELGSETLESEEEFDISEDIEQLSPEDLKDIEIEEDVEEAYTRELENEIGENISLSEGDQLGDGSLVGEEISDEDLEKELEQFDTSGMELEANLDEEEMDLDSYIKSVEDNIGEEIKFEETTEEELQKEAEESQVSEEAQEKELEIEKEPEIEDLEEGLLESPVLGEIEDIEIDAEEAFREAGIEDIDLSETEETESLPSEEELKESVEKEAELEIEEMPDLSELESELETGETTMEESSETGEPEGISEEIPEISIEEGGETLPEEEFEEEIKLTEEEEQILKEDIDLSAIPEETSEEEDEVVSLSGEELDRMVKEEQITEEEPETAVIDKTLLNDITVILKYLDDLLGDLPEEKIKEFANSKYFSLYKEVFNKLGISG